MIYLAYMGCLLSALLFLVRTRRRHFEFPVQATWDMTFAIMAGGFIGARLLHVLFEDWAFYQQNLANVFFFWYGGFVYYGGVVGAFIASLVFLYSRPPMILGRKNHFEDWLAWANFFTPVLSLGYAFGRLGCQIAGCCYGRYCDLPWAFEGRHPTALYLAACEFLIFIFLTQLERLPFVTLKYHLFFTWVFLNALARFIIEPLRDDFRGASLAGWSLSSWVSLILIAISGAIILGRKSTTVDGSAAQGADS